MKVAKELEFSYQVGILVSEFILFSHKVTQQAAKLKEKYSSWYYVTEHWCSNNTTTYWKNKFTIFCVFF